MSEEWSCRANRTMSWYRAAGGRLSIADGRLEFRPHAADRALGAGGPPELFVVSKLDDVIERIESLRAGGGT
jgi:hypothetical protein